MWMTIAKCNLHGVTFKKSMLKMVISFGGDPYSKYEGGGRWWTLFLVPFYASPLVSLVFIAFSLIVLTGSTMQKNKGFLQAINGSSQYRENVFLKLCATLHTYPTSFLS